MVECDLHFDVHLCSSCPQFQECMAEKLKKANPIIKEMEKADNAKEVFEKIHNLQEVI